jgi:hypothetical protein
MAKIELSAKLWSPMEGKGWTFATLPKDASERLGATNGSQTRTP